MTISVFASGNRARIYKQVVGERQTEAECFEKCYTNQITLYDSHETKYVKTTCSIVVSNGTFWIVDGTGDGDPSSARTFGCLHSVQICGSAVEDQKVVRPHSHHTDHFFGWQHVGPYGTLPLEQHPSGCHRL